MKNEQEVLQAFLKAKVNSVSRERIFHNKLLFDLKLAAARAGYHLSIFEPEVDRDAFDIFLDDGDNERRIQVKTVLASSTTKNWKSTKRFMRPGMIYGERLGMALADCGVGGGFLLVKINDSSADAPVTYSYTDYFVATALDMRLLCETTVPKKQGRGRRKDDRQKTASKFLRSLGSGNARDPIRLPLPLFVRPKSSDGLLALMNLHSSTGCYLPSDMILEAVEDRFEVDADGNPPRNTSLSTIRIVQSHIQNILALLDEPDLSIFNAPPSANRKS